MSEVTVTVETPNASDSSNESGSANVPPVVIAEAPNPAPEMTLALAVGTIQAQLEKQETMLATLLALETETQKKLETIAQLTLIVDELGAMIQEELIQGEDDTQEIAGAQSIEAPEVSTSPEPKPEAAKKPVIHRILLGRVV